MVPSSGPAPGAIDDGNRELVDEVWGDDRTQEVRTRRLSGTLAKIFQRRREKIGLSTTQVAALSGIDEDTIIRFEASAGQSRIDYEHVVVLARVLGVRASELPGLRAKETRAAAGNDPDDSGPVALGPALPVGDVPALLAELRRSMNDGPVLTFQGRGGEQYGGDLGRLEGAEGFTLQILDDALGEIFSPGALLVFEVGAPAVGEVVLLRHERTRVLALRRLVPPQFRALRAWQKEYAVESDWRPVGRLSAVLAPAR